MYRENYPHMKFLENIFAKFPPSEKNNHIYSKRILSVLKRRLNLLIHVNLLPQKIWRNFLENWLKNWRILSVFDISKMWVNNAKITYHVQRDIFSPLIKKSNSSFCIVYLSFCTLKQNIRVISFDRLTLG